MTGRERPVQMVAVIVAQPDAADGGLGVGVDQRGREIEGALQRLELERPGAPRRVAGLGVGLAGHGREDDRRLE